MNERTTLEKIAPSVDEAVAEGLAELGLTEEAVEVEVLDNGSRGLFGVGGRQARVRLTLKAEPAKPETAAPIPAPVSGEEDGDGDELISIARSIVAEMLDKMNISATIDARLGEMDEEGQRPVLLDIRGNDLAVLIGRRAEILNALQYIVNLMVSKQVEHWVQVVIDVEGYRARRDRQLRQMARRMADQAIKTGHRQTLEPMNSAERRIIHLELRDHPEVMTQSVGEEPGRKVTIVPK
jgi:spoIIIJ-associated protein